jgi:hypothetical protein
LICSLSQDSQLADATRYQARCPLAPAARNFIQEHVSLFARDFSGKVMTTLLLAFAPDEYSEDLFLFIFSSMTKPASARPPTKKFAYFMTTHAFTMRDVEASMPLAGILDPCHGIARFAQEATLAS